MPARAKIPEGPPAAAGVSLTSGDAPPRVPALPADLRDAPADAEALSHKLLVRGGFIRQVSAGLWTYLPLGWRVHRKVEQIVREEMDAIGAQEMLAPVLTPAELWITSGRYGIPELFKLEDRTAATTSSRSRTRRRSRSTRSSSRATGSCRSPGTTSRRRTATSRVRAAGPARPRVHHEGLVLVRPRRGRTRCQLRGASGRVRAHLEALRPRDVRRSGRERDDGRQRVARLPGAVGLRREHARHLRERRLRGRSRDRARRPRAPEFPEALDAPAEVETPDTRTCEALAELLSVDLAATSKAMPVVREDGTLVPRSCAATTGSRRRSCRARSGPTSGRRPPRRSSPASAPRAACSAPSASQGL